MLVLKDIATIGVERLIAILGYEDNYKEIIYIKGYDPVYCKKISCGMCSELEGQAMPEEEKAKVLEFFCNDCPMADKKMAIYHNEKNKYSSAEVLLSRSRLLHFVLLHYLCDSYGIIKSVSCKDIADEIGVTVRTIKDNFKFFIDKGLLYATKRDSDHYGLAIAGYRDYFKTKAEYGRGFLQITKEAFVILNKEKKINSIRLACRQFLEYSRVNINSDDNIKSAEFSYSKIKRFLPSYINCPKKINFIIKNSKIDVFDTEVRSNGIVFKLKPDFDSDAIRKDNIEKYKIKISEHIFKQGRILGNLLAGEPYDLRVITDIDVYIDDFVQMSLQYGLDLVLSGLNYLIEYIIKNNYTGNYGGVVRNRIKELIYGKVMSS